MAPQSEHLMTPPVNTSKHLLYKPRPPRYDPSEWFEPCAYKRMWRECTHWDQRGHRFLAGIFDGGISAIPFRPGCPAAHVHEHVLVSKPPYPGLSNLGLRTDYPRNRVVSCVSDKSEAHALSTVVAYDYTTWKTLFVIVLQKGKDNPSLANDLTLDPDGNIYITDTYNGKIWKVKSDGSEFCVFCDSPLFQLPPKNKAYRWVKLDGITYHPKGFLLVTHLSASALFKVSMDGKKVTRVGGLTRELLGDGIVLLSDNELAMAGLNAGCHILATNDDWETAVETHWSPPLSDTVLPSDVTVKDGIPFAIYVNLDIKVFNSIAQPHFVPLPPASKN